MTKTIKAFALALCGAALLALAPGAADAAPVVGEPAPDFEGTTATGEPFKLSDHKGDIVVLEWTNHECPFVVKHYETGNMQKIQKMATEEHGVKWVTIVSSAPGRQGHVSGEEAMAIVEEAGAHPTVKLLDESGEIGMAYDAQTTPHMFVIDAEGTLVYAGAIDDNSSPRHDTVEGAQNYVVAALESLKAGEPVATAQTPPYGCSVKYAN